MGRFVIRPVSTGVKFDLKAENGQVIASSEVYATASACRNGVESLRKCAATQRLADLTQEGRPCANPKFEMYLDKAGLFRFRLRSRNGKIVAASEGYTTKTACLAGIQSVIHNAQDAPVE